MIKLGHSTVIFAALISAAHFTPEIDRIEARLHQVRAFAQRCARDATSFIHTQLAQVKHDHCNDQAGD
jgi:hypothetical protein